MEIPSDNLPAKRATNVIVHSGFVVAGVVTVILGPILPILIARWSMTDERAGLFFTLQFCGNLLGIISLGSLISWRGYGQTLAAGFTFMALGIAALNLGGEILCPAGPGSVTVLVWFSQQPICFYSMPLNQPREAMQYFGHPVVRIRGFAIVGQSPIHPRTSTEFILVYPAGSRWATLRRDRRSSLVIRYQ